MKQLLKFNRFLISLRKTVYPKNSGNFDGVFKAFSKTTSRSFEILRMFYLINLFVWIIQLRNWDEFGAMTTLDPTWPIQFLVFSSSTEHIFKLFFVLNLIISLCVFYKPQIQLFRVLNFICLFLLSAVFNSDIGGWERSTESLNYSLVAFLLIFVDFKDEQSLLSKLKAMYILSAIQLLTIISYIHAAIWRVRVSIQDWFDGNLTMLDWGSLARAMSGMKFMTGQGGAFAEVILKYEFLYGPGLIFATLLELSLVYYLFKPKYYRLIGLELACLHIGFVLIFNFAFNEHLLLTLLFLAASPWCEYKKLRS